MPIISYLHRSSETRYEVECVLGTWTVLATWWAFDRHGEKEEVTHALSWHDTEAEARAALAKLQGTP